MDPYYCFEFLQDQNTEDCSSFFEPKKPSTQPQEADLSFANSVFANFPTQNSLSPLLPERVTEIADGNSSIDTIDESHSFQEAIQLTKKREREESSSSPQKKRKISHEEDESVQNVQSEEDKELRRKASQKHRENQILLKRDLEEKVSKLKAKISDMCQQYHINYELEMSSILSEDSSEEYLKLAKKIQNEKKEELDPLENRLKLIKKQNAGSNEIDDLKSKIRKIKNKYSARKSRLEKQDDLICFQNRIELLNQKINEIYLKVIDRLTQANAALQQQNVMLRQLNLPLIMNTSSM